MPQARDFTWNLTAVNKFLLLFAVRNYNKYSPFFLDRSVVSYVPLVIISMCSRRHHANHLPHILIIVVPRHIKFVDFLHIVWCLTSLSLEIWVDGKFEHVIDHSRDVPGQQLWRFFETRVRVDFNQPGVVFAIQNEVVPKQLEQTLTYLQLPLNWL